MNLHDLENSLIDDRFKSIPGGVEPFPLSRIAERGWNILRGDLPLPAAVLKQTAVAQNSRWMRRFLELTGAKICPHGKTTMAPQLFQQQLDDGAWGITLATAQQIQVARRFGVSRILLANQLLSRPAIEYVVRELLRDSAFEFLCLVDSVAGVEMLAAEAQRLGCSRPVEVLVEIGLPGKRCGCRDLEAAVAVARAVQQSSPFVQLRGVEGFEGVISSKQSAAAETQVREFVELLVRVARQFDAEQLFAPGRIVLTAGGSAFYDLVIAGLGRAGLSRETDVIIRSGCYLTHDSLGCQKLFEQLLARSPQARELGAGLRPALEVWSHVQSRPEPTRAILTMGKRDCSFDIELPLPTHWFRHGTHSRPEPIPLGHTIVSLNDQHAWLDLPTDSPLAVGDLVASGISHPCTTFDRWQLIPVVDDDYNVVAAVRTFF